MNHSEFPRLSFDPQTGRAQPLQLSDAQYTTLVATAKCPLVLPAGDDTPATRCREPLLLPCTDWAQGDHRTLTGDWLCADGHGPGT